MQDGYEPESDFLAWVISGDVPLVGNPLADANFRRVIALMSDKHPANRDWATFLVAQEEVDTPEVRAALLAAAQDEEAAVRAEAICGLARLDSALAVPLIRAELQSTGVLIGVFEAAALVADPSLVSDLRPFASDLTDDWISQSVVEAINACERRTTTA